MAGSLTFLQDGFSYGAIMRMAAVIINNTLNFKLHKLTFTTAHLHFTAAQIVINCTLKYALLSTIVGAGSNNDEDDKHVILYKHRHIHTTIHCDKSIQYLDTSGVESVTDTFKVQYFVRVFKILFRYVSVSLSTMHGKSILHNIFQKCRNLTTFDATAHLNI